MIRSKIRQVDPNGEYVLPGALLNNFLERLEKLENLRGGGGTVVKDTGYGFRVWSQGGGGPAKLPKPQYRFMQLGGVSQNQTGFDWDRATPTL